MPSYPLNFLLVPFILMIPEEPLLFLLCCPLYIRVKIRITTTLFSFKILPLGYSIAVNNNWQWVGSLSAYWDCCLLYQTLSPCPLPSLAFVCFSHLLLYAKKSMGLLMFVKLSMCVRFCRFGAYSYKIFGARTVFFVIQCLAKQNPHL